MRGTLTDIPSRVQLAKREVEGREELLLPLLGVDSLAFGCNLGNSHPEPG